MMIRTYGAFQRDPLYNCLQQRDVTVSAVVRGLLSIDDIRQKSGYRAAGNLLLFATRKRK